MLSHGGLDVVHPFLPDTIGSCEPASPRGAIVGTTEYAASARSAAAQRSSDDYANTFSQAAPITLGAGGSGQQSGVIESARDIDVFKFVAPTSGQMTITESATPGSRLDSYLYVFDSSHRLVAYNDDSGGTLNSSVTIDVSAGSTYYVAAAAYGRSTGAYVLGFSTAGDDFPDTFASAAPLTLDASGGTRQSGNIDWAGDVDAFQFVAPTAGQVTIGESAAPGSQLDSYLYVYDSSHRLVAYNDDSGGTLNSSVTIDVSAGSTYYVAAAAYGWSTGAYVLQVDTAPATPTPSPPPSPSPSPPPSGAGDFQITLDLAGLTASEQDIALQAAARWEQVIIGDVPDVSYGGQLIDDVLINIQGQAIDGRGGILGEGGPEGFRSGSDLPYLGSIILDTADMSQLESAGQLLDVFTHEIGHVLGLGTIWSSLGLLSGARTSNPLFIGAQATAAYNALFGTNASGVPVEAGGGAGTALGHWRESVFGNELMTGWLNSGSNPLSIVTVASMADLGYQVNLAAAEPYSPPGALRQAASLAAQPAGNGASLRAIEMPSALPGAETSASAFPPASAARFWHEPEPADPSPSPRLAAATSLAASLGTWDLPSRGDVGSLTDQALDDLWSDGFDLAFSHVVNDAQTDLDLLSGVA